MSDLISMSLSGKSCEIPELSAISIVMTTHQNSANLKQMPDIFMVTELRKKLRV